MTTEAQRTVFEDWFESEYPKVGENRPKYQTSCVMDLMADAWNAATLAERERAAQKIEKMTERRRLIHAGGNALPVAACEFAAAIREGQP